MPGKFDEVLREIERRIENVPKRPFDTYILPPFLIWYGIKSKNMPILARRMVVTAGIYGLYYSWRQYRTIPEDIKKLPQLFTEKFKVVDDT